MRQVAAVVAAGQADLRLGIRGRASAHHHRAYRMSDQKAGNTGRRRARSGFAGEEIAGPRKTKAGGIQQRGRENVRLFQTGDLLPQIQNVGAVRIEVVGVTSPPSSMV